MKFSNLLIMIPKKLIYLSQKQRNSQYAGIELIITNMYEYKGIRRQLHWQKKIHKIIKNHQKNISG
jgi:hypothetical protein